MLTEVALLATSSLIDNAAKIAPLLTHPSSWVRHGALGFFGACNRHFTPTETYCQMRPILKPFLARPLLSIESEHLAAALRPPVSRRAFDHALACAAVQEEALSSAGALPSPTTAAFPAATASADGGGGDVMAVGGTSVSGEDIEKIDESEADLLDIEAVVGDLPDRELDLSSIDASLEPGEAPTLQAMRRYVRDASIAKMAKVRLWESENMAQLQLAGGGGGVELLPFRTLSQHVKVHRLIPEGAAAMDAPVGAIGSTKGGEQGRVGSTKGGGTGVGACTPTGGSTKGAPGSGARRGSGGVVHSIKEDEPFAPPAGGVRGDSLGSAMGTPDGKDSGGEARRGSSNWAKASKAFSSNLTTKGVFGKSSKQYVGHAAGGGGGGVGHSAGGLAEDMWPVGMRMPSTWHSCTQPGSLVATLRAHAEGVRQMCLSPDHRLLYTRGTNSAVKAWSLQRVVDENAYAPAARHAPPPGTSACSLAVCGDEQLLALGATDGSVQLLAPDRLGGSSTFATAWGFQLAAEDDQLLMLAGLHSGAGGGGGAGSSPLLLYTTEGGSAVAVDTRAGRDAWRVRHEPPLGLMQAHAGDAGGNWLLFGSSTGHCVLWDVRYGIELKQWQCPGAPRIRSMLHVRPAGSARPTVLIGANDNLVTGWELGEATPRCTLLLQPAETSDAIATAAMAPPSPPMSFVPPVASGASAAVNGPHSVRTLLAPADASCVLTGSSDTRLRCWRLTPGEAANSYTLGGMPNGVPTTAVVETHATWVPSGARVLQELEVPREPSGQAPSAAAGKGGAAASAVGADDRGFAAAVSCAAFCHLPQPGLLAAGSLDGTVRIWR